MSDLTHVLHFNQSCVKAASLTKIYGLLDFYTNIAGVRFLRYESWRIPKIIESRDFESMLKLEKCTNTTVLKKTITHPMFYRRSKMALHCKQNDKIGSNFDLLWKIYSFHKHMFLTLFSIGLCDYHTVLQPAKKMP